MFLYTLIFVAALIEITLRDIRFYEISDITLLFFSCGGIAYSYTADNLNFYGVLTGGILLAGVSLLSRGGLGWGDIKLGAAAGLWLSWQQILAAELLAFWLGGLYAAYLLLFRRKSRKTMIPFAPFLAVGILTSFFQGADIMTLYWQVLGL